MRAAGGVQIASDKAISGFGRWHLLKRSVDMNQAEIAALGASLRPIDQKLLKAGQCQRTRLWYQGGEPYFDVFFELSGEEMVWFQFTLRGKSITWSRGHKDASTGLTHEDKIEDCKYPGSKLITTDSVSDQSFVNLARSILQIRAEEPIFQQAIAILTQENSDPGS